MINCYSFKTTMATTSSSIIKLNVGGKQFQTTASTLQGSLFLTRMLNGSIPTLKDENGAYFIDRDPKYFKIILSYLRTFRWDIPASMEKRIVLEEAEFYMIVGLLTNQSLKPVGLTPAEDVPANRYGFYSDNRSQRLFLHNTYGVLNCNAVGVEYSMSLFTLADNHYKQQIATGLFVNDGRSMVLIEGNHSYLLESTPPKVPSTIIQLECRIPNTYHYLQIKADAEKVVFTRKTEAASYVVAQRGYKTDNTTGLITSSMTSPGLNAKAYVFGVFIVVEVNGAWTT